MENGELLINSELVPLIMNSIKIQELVLDYLTFVKLSIKNRDMVQQKEFFAFRRSFNQFAASLYKE